MCVCGGGAVGEWARACVHACLGAWVRGCVGRVGWWEAESAGMVAGRGAAPPPPAPARVRPLGAPPPSVYLLSLPPHARTCMHRYGSYGLSSRVVDRIWMLRRDTAADGMTYNDFVFFLLSEEDKQSTASLQYWFHVLDCNADGLLDAHDIRFFHEDLQTRLEAMGEEIVPFDEIFNEVMDMVAPARRGKLALSELRKSGLGCAQRHPTTPPYTVSILQHYPRP